MTSVRYWTKLERQYNLTDLERRLFPGWARR